MSTEVYTINGKQVSKAEYEAFRSSIDSTTLPSRTDNARQARQQTAEIFTPEIDIYGAGRNLPREETPEVDYGARPTPAGDPGAMPKKQKGDPVVNVYDVGGKKLGQDLRVKILVPPNYWTKITSGPNGALRTLKGVIFPYTPSIQFDLKADYSSATPLHSNFQINFYQKSSIGNISVSGKFTVESKNDALVLLSTMHLLKSLTRMRSGGRTGDPDSGSPPPVCRLVAHGKFILDNVPVAIGSVRMELPDSVDYFTIVDDEIFGSTSVPVVSTISVTCIPMYSRAEMQDFSVTKYINNESNFISSKGFV